MIRLVRMGGKWYCVEVGKYLYVEEVVNIEEFVNAGEPVLLCCDLEQAKECLGTDDIEMVQ